MFILHTLKKKGNVSKTSAQKTKQTWRGFLNEQNKEPFKPNFFVSLSEQFVGAFFCRTLQMLQK
jgi:hypothetical protein